MEVNGRRIQTCELRGATFFSQIWRMKFLTTAALLLASFTDLVGAGADTKSVEDLLSEDVLFWGRRLDDTGSFADASMPLTDPSEPVGGGETDPESGVIDDADPSPGKGGKGKGAPSAPVAPSAIPPSTGAGKKGKGKGKGGAGKKGKGGKGSKAPSPFPPPATDPAPTPQAAAGANTDPSNDPPDTMAGDDGSFLIDWIKRFFGLDDRRNLRSVDW